ncbi:hypothetical protein K402DRAFT_157658 [Aulographum hederae CBS 113979]|uniref:Uncharacterized protein n=1 Tax=Aulographum hederae CBS 113979 TaxID=1176131 RepID=A0A6G1GSX3_9PEZI|nr:hypothetical protein K402DRAFT_157658 [Aulographum hederae CBS 113979]
MVSFSRDLLPRIPFSSLQRCSRFPMRIPRLTAASLLHASVARTGHRPRGRRSFCGFLARERSPALLRTCSDMGGYPSCCLYSFTFFLPGQMSKVFMTTDPIWSSLSSFFGWIELDGIMRGANGQRRMQGQTISFSPRTFVRSQFEIPLQSVRTCCGFLPVSDKLTGCHSAASSSLLKDFTMMRIKPKSL